MPVFSLLKLIWGGLHHWFPETLNLIFDNISSVVLLIVPTWINDFKEEDAPISYFENKMEKMENTEICNSLAKQQSTLALH